MGLNLHQSKPITNKSFKKSDTMTDRTVFCDEVPPVGIVIKQEQDVDLCENLCTNGLSTNIQIKQEIEDVDDLVDTLPGMYENDFKLNRSVYQNTYKPAKKDKLKAFDVPIVHIKKEVEHFDFPEDCYAPCMELNCIESERCENQRNFMSNLENEIDAFKIKKIPCSLEPGILKIKEEISVSKNNNIIKKEPDTNEDSEMNSFIHPNYVRDKLNYEGKSNPEILNLCTNQMVNVFTKDKVNPSQKSQNKQKSVLKPPLDAKHKIKKIKLGRLGHKLRRDGMYICDLCGRRFGVKQSLIRHIQLPHVQPRAQLTKPLAQSCELTPDLIRSELDNLTRHGKEVDRKCIICLKSFDRKGCAKRHLIEHIVSNCRAASRYQCPLCDAQQFFKVDEFKHHMRVHASLTTYKCRICNKSFGDSSNFSKHKKVHGSTHGQCSMCNRKFRTAKMMELHMEHHKHIKPIKCPKCDRIFYFESVLKKHLKGAHAKREMNSPKSYGCCECDQRFQSLKEKWRHQWSVHSVRKRRVDCWICDARFRIVTDLRSHLNKNHGINVTCKKITQKQNKDPVPPPTA